MRGRVALVVLAGLLTVSGCTIDLSGAKPEPSMSTARPPTVGGPVVLDTSVPGWETAAWLSGDALCVRAARVKPQTGKPNESIYCDPVPQALKTIGPPLLPSKPLPYVNPSDPQSRKILLIGTLRGAVASVSVTMFGQTATASVHPLPATGSRHVGAYAVWLPHSDGNRNGMDISDITAVVGRDAAGTIVTRLD